MTEAECLTSASSLIGHEREPAREQRPDGLGHDHRVRFCLRDQRIDVRHELP
jgi:hypothetical protein